jgi:DeoR/GlpR family transcriptional regulator of sugar metabolism
VLADHTKLGRVATTHVVPLTAIDTVVTDTGAPTQAIADLQAAGTNVIVAELTP